MCIKNGATEGAGLQGGLFLEIEFFEVPGDAVGGQAGGADVGDVGADGGGGQRSDGVDHGQLLGEDELDLVEKLLSLRKIQRAHLSVQQRIHAGFPVGGGCFLAGKPLVQVFGGAEHVHLGGRV